MRDTSKPVNIVLAWSDPAANPGGTRNLVNDLNLRVRVNCGIRNGGYIGNFFGSGNSSSVNVCGFDPGYDTKDNVEAT